MLLPAIFVEVSTPLSPLCPLISQLHARLSPQNIEVYLSFYRFPEKKRADVVVLFFARLLPMTSVNLA